MKNTRIPLSETGQFSSLLQQYLSGEESLSPFYHRFPKIENFGEQISEKQKSFSAESRKVLVEVLKKQYEGIENAPISTLESLADETTFTVVTGHQLNIFTGPLYFIYKIVTVINMAKELKVKYPDYNFVPVYWMATEDHDFAEISYFNLFGKKFSWENESASGAVGRLSNSGLEAILEEFKECPELFREAYSDSENLAVATRKIVNGLFHKQGLVIVDGDSPQLKKQLVPVIKNDLTQHDAAKKVRTTNEALEAAGFGSQAFVRDINFFYLNENLRNRIEKLENGRYEVVDTSIQFSETELLEEVEKHPENFSPNVIVRPLYQEVVLPNLAYIGGPAEVAYWLQLKGMFDHFEVPFPMVFPRNFALVIPKNLQSKIEKLKLRHTDLFLEENELKKAYLDHNSENEIELTQEQKDAELLFSRIARTAERIDPSLVGFVEAESKKMLKSIENIEKRLKKSEERNHEVAITQLIKLKEKLFPNGAPQERVDNFMNFYLNDQSFIDRLLVELAPFDFRFNVLEYQA